MGSVFRYLMQLMVNRKLSGVFFPFSWGTFLVNTIGCLFIGVFYSLSERFQWSMEMRLFLTVGLCGGFTTFSTYANDGLSLLKGELYAMFFLYTILSVVLGIVSVFVGGYIGKYL